MCFTSGAALTGAESEELQQVLEETNVSYIVYNTNGEKFKTQSLWMITQWIKSSADLWIHGQIWSDTIFAQIQSNRIWHMGS